MANTSSSLLEYNRYDKWKDLSSFKAVLISAKQIEAEILHSFTGKWGHLHFQKLPNTAILVKKKKWPTIKELIELKFHMQLYLVLENIQTFSMLILYTCTL